MRVSLSVDSVRVAVCVFWGNPLSTSLPSLLGGGAEAPSAERGAGAEPRGSLPKGSAGVKRAQREPRDARESASARRGARATVAGAGRRVGVELPKGSREDGRQARGVRSAVPLPFRRAAGDTA